VLEKTEMGRVTAEFVVANNRDVVNLGDGDNVLDKVKHIVVSGIVDSGAAQLVLPQRVVDELQLQVDGETTVRFADNRREKRQIVGNVWLELLGRHGVYKAVVEPARDDALIGAIVLEDLDLLIDCRTQSLYPRESDSTLTEIE
jgi:predicted aspartyl protease